MSHDAQHNQGKQSAKASAGQKVHYTGHDGRQHEATIDKLDGEYADLTVHMDGKPTPVTAVPHNQAGSTHSWMHQQ